MRIYFDGCSNTEGKHLSSKSGFTLGTAYKSLRWTRKLSRKLNAQECNYAYSGGSNDRILRNISRKYYHDLHNYDLAVIQLTFPHRFEWYDNDKKTFRTLSHSKFRMMTDKKHKFDLFHSFWKSYYDKGMFSDEQGEAREEICFNTIRSICRDKDLPLILISCNPDTKLSYDYMMIKSHPTRTEQIQVYKDIYEIYTKL